MKKFLSVLFITSSIFASAQAYLGVHNSNYIGVMGTQIQPASFVDGRFAFDMNIASLNFNTYQNFGYFNAKAMREAQGNGGFGGGNHSETQLFIIAGQAPTLALLIVLWDADLMRIQRKAWVFIIMFKLIF